MRILLDTDIGDDIDDALALALALRLTDVELVGVTTVFRDTGARARMARYLLDRFGRQDVPVYIGTGKPLAGSLPRAELEPQLTLTPDTVAHASSTHAVDFIRSTYAMPDSDVTLVTIGPLTNLALALAIDPNLAQRIPRVVAMGGCVGRAAPEWNILCDATAAQIVLGAGLSLTLVPLDVTMETRMRQEQIDAMRAVDSDQMRWLMTLIEAWYSRTNHLPVLHDPLALAIALDPGLVETQPLALDVVTAPGPGHGITCMVGDQRRPVDVALRVDGPRFVDWFTAQLTAA
jgi:inosine-uridine nucleoside N-ribohydrolase